MLDRFCRSMLLCFSGVGGTGSLLSISIMSSVWTTNSTSEDRSTRLITLLVLHSGIGSVMGNIFVIDLCGSDDLKWMAPPDFFTTFLLGNIGLDSFPVFLNASLSAKLMIGI